MAKKKRLYDDEGNEVKGAKVKKPFYKRWWFIAIVVLGIIGAVSGEGDEDSNREIATEETTETVDEAEIVEEVEAVEETEAEVEQEPESEPEPEPESEPEPEPELEVEPEPEVEEVPREHRNALQKAESYLSWAGMSEIGLAEQLTFEEFPQEAIDYALANVDVDYNEQALMKAESYDEWAGMSDQGLIDQLLFEGFTQEQAQYAIDNLE